jgi:hypothetical protein
MRLRSLFRRRPSASMVVSVTALFVALGGVGWAAVALPANSVGTTQLQNASVTNHKLLNGSVGNFKLAFGAVGSRKMANAAVGTAQINPNQVQARVSGTCAATGGAINSITSAGKVQCGSAPPQEFGASTTTAVTVLKGATATPITTKSLPGSSSYLVFANPSVRITGGTVPPPGVEVDCTLSVGPTAAATQTGSYTVQPGADDQAASIPLMVTAPSNPNVITATVTCAKKFSGTPEPTVVVSTSINAIQTASNS